MKHFLLLGLILILPFISNTLAAQEKNTEIRLGVFGDSLSAGYHLKPSDAFYTQLEQALRARGWNVRALNLSRSGATTADGLRRLKEALAKQPDALLIELGINDALRDISLSVTEKNLSEIIDSVQDKGIPVMLIGMKIPYLKSQAYQEDFANVYEKLAQRYALILYPFFMEGLFTSLPGLPVPLISDDMTLPDHLHPSAKGVTKMVENILPEVERFLIQSGFKK